MVAVKAAPIKKYQNLDVNIPGIIDKGRFFGNTPAQNCVLRHASLLYLNRALAENG